MYRDISADQLHIPLMQVIYVGDGASDIPCFSILHQEQGTAIGVYKERFHALLENIALLPNSAQPVK